MNATFQDKFLCGYCGMQTPAIVNVQRSPIAVPLATPLVYFSSYLFFSANFLFRPIVKSEKNSLFYTCQERLSSTAFTVGTLSGIYKYVVPDIQHAYDSYLEHGILIRYKSIALKIYGFLLSLLKGHVLEVP